MTLAKLAGEIHGVVVGTINVGGTTYRVFFNLSRPTRLHGEPGQHRIR
jgi:hypothetical protein